MSLAVLLSIVCWCSSLAVHADERKQGVEARALFEQGVQKARQEAWQDAALLLERSLELVERPATALNLMLVYDHLDQPLDVVRMVRRLLVIADPVRHENERQEALRFESRAFAQLGQLILTLTPSHTVVTVDGEPGVFMAPQQLMLTPGSHTLHFAAPGFEPRTLPTSSVAGVRGELALALESVTQAPLATTPSLAPSPMHEPATPPPLRPILRARRASIALTLIGAASLVGALAAEGLAWSRAQDLNDRSPREPGFLSRADDYTRVRRAVGPTAFAGAALTASGWVWNQRVGDRLDLARGAPQKPRRRLAAGLTGALSLALIGVGAALWVIEPERLGTSALRAPSRDLGMLLCAAGIPGLSWTFGEVTR